MWTGRMLFGMIECVPGRFFTAPEFTHIAFFPIYPHRTWIVLPGSVGESSTSSEDFTAHWDSVPIPLSWKSVRLAWTRALLWTVFCLGLISLMLSSLTLLSNFPSWGWIAGSLAACALSWAVNRLLKSSILIDREQIDASEKMMINKFGPDVFSHCDPV